MQGAEAEGPLSFRSIEFADHVHLAPERVRQKASGPVGWMWIGPGQLTVAFDPGCVQDLTDQLPDLAVIVAAPDP